MIFFTALAMPMPNEVTVVATLRRSTSKINSLFFKDKSLFALDSDQSNHCFSDLFRETPFKHEQSILETAFVITFNNDLILIHDGKAHLSGDSLCDGLSKHSFLSPILFRDNLMAPAESDDGDVLCFNANTGSKHILSSGEGMLLGLAVTKDFILTLNDDGFIKVFDACFDEVHKEKLPVVGACSISAESSTIVIGSVSGHFLSYQFTIEEVSLISKKRFESVITKVHLNLPFVFISFNHGNTFIYQIENLEEPISTLEYTPASVFMNLNNQNIPHWYKQSCIYDKVTVIGCQNGILRIVGLQ